MRIQITIVHIYAQITQFSEQYIDSLYNDVGETLGKECHYTTVMEHFSAQVGKLANSMEKAIDNLGVK